MRPYRTKHSHNPLAERKGPYGPAQARVLDLAGFEAARREITSWPGYAPTPLIPLDGLAARAGLGRIWYKDESRRFGLGSFKALGGAYAVYRLLAADVAKATARPSVAASELVGRTHRKITEAVTVCCATDGNHGRSVAWGAQSFGCNCVIYISTFVSEGRKRAMEAYDAKVVRIDGNYDDSVREAAVQAARQGWFVISDTSYEGYTAIPRDVMQGYVVMADEAIEQLPANERPSHIFVQGGVGGLAAAVLARFWQLDGAGRPRFVVVEPEAAACIYASLSAGKPVAVGGSLETVMAGLSAGEVSILAWELLKPGVDDVMTVEDAAASELMRLLARGEGPDPPIVAGESGVAGLAGALAACADPDLSAAFGLDERASILVFGTEGATDPEVYREIVGRAPEEVAPA
ncbi:MAG: diaminopropionate ammonia-lyase [Alphaproteobacteria bacterium]